MKGVTFIKWFVPKINPPLMPLSNLQKKEIFFFSYSARSRRKSNEIKKDVDIETEMTLAWELQDQRPKNNQKKKKPCN